MMRGIVKGKWIIILAWIVIVAGLLFTAPGMADLVREKGNLDVPEGYSSSLAADLLKDIQQEGDSSAALVFTSEKKLSERDMLEIEQGINSLEKDKSKLGIAGIMTHFNEPALKEQLVSEDGKTVLVSLTMNMKDREPKQVIEALYNRMKGNKVDHYFTGDWIISEDLNTNSQEGLKKTEGITVVFILVVLLLVFRSVVTPIIPLITVGFSYLASQSVVAFLVDRFDFPISSYTQIFLVAVLFGIGTDYCILLLSRYKEELAKQESILEAIVETYRTGGKTVFYSGLAVMIGFAAIGFSTFKLYQSAAAVAIGVAFLLLALYTVVPFFMAVFGMKLFWPSKGKLEHKESRFWGFLGTFALNRPVIALTFVAVVCVPFLLTYNGEVSYNSLEEAGDDVPSIRAFNIIAESFGPGQSMPTQIVINNDEQMNSEEYIGLAEKISASLSKIEGVDTVRSVTRPTGEPIKELFVPNQAATLEEGIGKGNDGIEEISKGLKTAGSELSKSSPQLKKATDGIDSLIKGTDELKGGVGQVQTGLGKIEQGIRDGSMGSGEINKGLKEINTNLRQLAEGTTQLTKGYRDAASGLGTVKKEYDGIQNNINTMAKSLGRLDSAFKGLENSNPELLADGNYQTIKQTVQGVESGLVPVAAGMRELNKNLAAIQGGLGKANKNLADVASGQTKLAAGIEKLIAGVSELQNGLMTAANGQNQIIGNLSSFEGGLDSINNGQQELLTGFSGLNGQMNELSDGLTNSSKGLDQVHDGLNSTESYLSGLAAVEDSIAGVHIPKELLESDDFAQVLETYLPGNHKIMTLDVIFKKNPYSNDAINKIDDLEAAVKQATLDTKLEHAEVAIGGTTSTYNDLGNLSDADFSRTVTLMLSGIAIILFLMLRSVVMPIYLILSLILTYFTAASITELLYVDLLGYDGIGWAVPFFAFVILIALGIDYSIFLMDRFNEYKDRPVKEAMLVAMRKMGTVIISAAIILGGTFAAMMPAGVLSLLQIATLILIGLVLYVLVILPLFIPVMAKLFGRANWWPFVNHKNSDK